MKKIIIANFKMNKTSVDTEAYLNEFLPLVKDEKTKICICFPYTSLAKAKELTKGTNVYIGAQNVHDEEKGAYTGEVSAEMLKAENVSYVLVGHSERRKNNGETNKIINKKIKRALVYGLKVVFCFGESLLERQSGKTLAVLEKQINEALNGLYENELENIIFAYEPIWAIGTGKAASVKQIDEVVKHIRMIIGNNFSENAGKKVLIVYGGSINNKNAKSYLSSKNIDGALVGGSSLSATMFADIIKN